MITLHDAARSGDLDKCQRLLKEKDTKWNAVDANGETAFYVAVASGHEDVWDLLENYTTNIWQPNALMQTPLHAAAKGGNVAFCHWLCDREVAAKWLVRRMRANPNGADSNGDTAFSLAAAAGYSEVSELLKVIEDCQGLLQTPLHVAAEAGNTAAVSEFCDNWIYDHGEGPAIDPNAEDCDGKTAFHIAAAAGNLEICKCLEEASADTEIKMWTTNAYKRTPLHDAAENGHIAVCELLCCTDAELLDVDAEDVNGETAFFVAIAAGHLEVCKLLAEYTKDIWNPNVFKQTPLHAAAQNGHVEVCRWLCNQLDDAELRDQVLNSCDPYLPPPLQLAAEAGHLEVCTLLIESGADQNAMTVTMEREAEAEENRRQKAARIAAIAARQVPPALCLNDELRDLHDQREARSQNATPSSSSSTTIDDPRSTRIATLRDLLSSEDDCDAVCAVCGGCSVPGRNELVSCGFGDDCIQTAGESPRRAFWHSACVPENLHKAPHVVCARHEAEARFRLHVNLAREQQQSYVVLTIPSYNDGQYDPNVPWDEPEPPADKQPTEADRQDEMECEEEAGVSARIQQLTQPETRAERYAARNAEADGEAILEQFQSAIGGLDTGDLTPDDGVTDPPKNSSKRKRRRPESPTTDVIRKSVDPAVERNERAISRHARNSVDPAPNESNIVELDEAVSSGVSTVVADAASVSQSASTALVIADGPADGTTSNEAHDAADNLPSTVATASTGSVVLTFGNEANQSERTRAINQADLQGFKPPIDKKQPLPEGWAIAQCPGGSGGPGRDFAMRCVLARSACISRGQVNAITLYNKERAARALLSPKGVEAFKQAQAISSEELSALRDKATVMSTHPPIELWAMLRNAGLAASLDSGVPIPENDVHDQAWWKVLCTGVKALSSGASADMSAWKDASTELESAVVSRQANS